MQKKRQSEIQIPPELESKPLQPSFAKTSLDSHLPWNSGPHSGKGPKGYRRADDRILEDINEALTRHPEIDASEIKVRVENAVVTLSGTIESRQMKRLAEDCVEEVTGVEDVNNELRIDATLSSRARTSEFGAQESTSRSVRT